MYLIVDQGNTFTKVAISNSKELAGVGIFDNSLKNQLFSEINAWIASSDYDFPTSGIISSVTNSGDEFIKNLDKKIKLIEMSSKLRLPIDNRYETPETLGNDRIAAVVAASRLLPGAATLCLDAGTCLTFDFINSRQEYLGGAISPGITMRLKALNTFTGKLPLVSLDEDFDLIGNTTSSSILSGVMNGIIEEANGIIRQYQQEYPDLRVVLTGGDANYFEDKLKSNIFAVPNLVLLGLKDILIYNVEG